MKQCPICGQEIQDPATRCENCERWAAGVAAAVPPAAPPVAPQPALPTRQLIWIALIVVASGAVTLAALMSRADGAREAAAGVVNAGSTSGSKAGSSASSAARQRWSSENSVRWMADARGSVAFDLPAENTVQIWTRRVRPVLVVRCGSGMMEAFVFTESALAIEANTQDHTVTFTIDDRAARSERWPDSMDHDALFAPNGRAFAEELAHASQLRIGYTPHNAAPVTAEFSVRGLGGLLASSKKSCGL